MSSRPLISRNACPWCGSTQFSTLCAYPYGEEPLVSVVKSQLGEAVGSESFIVCECTACGVIFQRDILKPDEHVDLYESWSYTETGIDFILFYLQELLMVRSYFHRPASEVAILDYGMGWGKFCDVAQSLDFNVSGFDIAREKRAFAARRGIRVVDDLGQIPRESLDFINLEQVLEHVPEPRRLVDDLAALLKPGGLFKISVPHRSRSLKRRLKRLKDTPASEVNTRFMEVWPLGHINAFTRGSLKSILYPDLQPERIHLNSMIFMRSARDGLRPSFNIIARSLYKNYHPRSNYLFFKKK